jgi:phosphatidylglycerol:prolipoprotein diacylglycerol transferase
MVPYPNIDPVAVSIGPLKVHWYGLMYVLGIAAAWLLGKWRAKSERCPITPEQVDDLIFYVAVGLIIGGRVGYILFYNFSGFLADPLVIFKVWQGGMSFHGGLIGALIATWLFARRYRHGFFEVTDFNTPLVPIGLGAGRIGNFINGELWGKPTDVPWAMVFPAAGPVARHPSQLYEALLEGLMLFLITWLYSSRPRPTMAVTGLGILLYGVFRFVVEFVRLPDAHIGYLAFGWLTMGQLLSLPMIVIGMTMWGLAYRRAW